MFNNKPKTFTSVLMAASTVIDDLREVSNDANNRAAKAEEEANTLMVEADNDRREATKANIVSERMATLIVVSDDDIENELN